MYRLFLTILLCLKAVSPAPQNKDSDVTYVKIQPVEEDTLVVAASNLRESRIEKLPLTIPGNVSKTDSKEPDKNVSKKTDLSEIKPDVLENKSETLSESLEVSGSKQSEALSEASATKEASTDTTDDLPETSPTDDLHLSGSDTVPLETYLTDRRARNFDSVETTETAEDITERYQDELIDHTADAPRTRAPPKFVPKGPKLSYFQKPRLYNRYSSNLLENGTKRRFRSHCSCQKIWNCPKLQITVPRCPDEYFLCCF